MMKKSYVETARFIDGWLRKVIRQQTPVTAPSPQVA
jgi:hypothetical protein